MRTGARYYTISFLDSCIKPMYTYFLWARTIIMADFWKSLYKLLALLVSEQWCNLSCHKWTNYALLQTLSKEQDI